jgi:hypothetical protein
VGQAQQAHLQQRQSLRPLRDHPHGARAETSERGGNEAIRSRRQALPRRVLPAGGIPDHDPHHARGRRSFQE